ncbi:MAG: RsmE family RNA methyltransferase [Myxococcota bacterium]
MSVRVFAPVADPGLVGLDAEESHYLVRVRRARAGDAIEVLHPGGGGWTATVEDAHPKAARIRVEAPLAPRPPDPIDLVVGLPDAKAAYDVVARASEAGARSLRFVHTTRSQPAKLNAERVERVLRAAQRQCGRLGALELHPPEDLPQWLARTPAGFVAALAGPGTTRPSPRSGSCSVLIGPEGGLTPAEEQAALDVGLTPLRLGPFVLRTEVAVVAALTAVRGSVPL